MRFNNDNLSQTQVFYVFTLFIIAFVVGVLIAIPFRA